MMAEYVEIAGSGDLRVTTRADLARATTVVERTEATDRSDLMQSQISDFWQSLLGWGFSPSLIEKVWTANRCIQLNAQMIGSMPLRFFGGYEPSWVANPDPVWYPNGMGDASYAMSWSWYGYGDVFLYITDRYANGFPSGFTVLDPAPMSVNVRDGKRVYKSGSHELNPDDIVHILRNPRPGGVRGTSALSSYSSYLYGLLASSELARALTGESGVPHTVLKSKRRLTEDQASKLQLQWQTKTSLRGGGPAILPPDVEFEQLAFNPKDLLLLDVQQFDARVIASAFGVPPFMVNVPLEGGLTYQSPEMLGEHWWRFELLPASGSLARGMSQNMLARGSYVEYDAKATLAPAFKDSVAAFNELLTAGVVTVNEVRAAVLNLGPLEQGEALAELTVPPTASASPAQQSAAVVPLRQSQG